MKNKFLALCCVVLSALTFITTSFAADPVVKKSSSIGKGAYARVAPYVNDDTFLVVRLDVDMIDLEELSATIDEFFLAYLKERGFSRNDLNAANREFKKTLEIVKTEFQHWFEIRDALGVREAYFLVQRPTDQSFRLFIPLSSTKREALKPFLAQVLPLPIVDAPNGLILTADVKADEKIYKNFTAKQNEPIKKFLDSTAGSTFQVYCSGLRFNEFFAQLTTDERKELDAVLAKYPPEVSKAFKSFDSYFRYMTVSYNFNKGVFKSELAFATAERAEDVRVGLEKAADYQIDYYAQQVVEKAGEAYNLPALSREFGRAVVRKFLPIRTDSVLRFESSPETKSFLLHPGLAPVHALALVAVQTAIQYAHEADSKLDKKTEESSSTEKGGEEQQINFQ